MGRQCRVAAGAAVRPALLAVEAPKRKQAARSAPWGRLPLNLQASSPRPSGRAVDDGAVGRRRGEDGVLDQPCKAVGDAGRGAAVEAEDVLVEPRVRLAGPRPGSGLQMLRADRTVVGAEQPALGEPEDEVDCGQAQRGIAQEALRLTGSWS